jgi:hypothetical protein
MATARALPIARRALGGAVDAGAAPAPLLLLLNRKADQTGRRERFGRFDRLVPGALRPPPPAARAALVR